MGTSVQTKNCKSMLPITNLEEEGLVLGPNKLKPDCKCFRNPSSKIVHTRCPNYHYAFEDLYIIHTKIVTQDWIILVPTYNAISML